MTIPGLYLTDADLLVRNWKERGDPAKALRWPAASFPEHWRLDLSKAARLARLAICLSDELIGSISVRRDGSLTMYIHPGYWSLGYGRRALALVAPYMLHHCRLIAWLVVAADNIRARKSYAAAGFTVERVYIQEGYTWVEMAWNIPSDVRGARGQGTSQGLTP